MYAITFDFDMEVLEKLHHNASRCDAYADVRRFLEDNGFENKQGAVYLAVGDISAVECVATVQDLSDEFDWFTPSLRDIRMLRIEKNNDLMIALDRKRRRKRS